MSAITTSKQSHANADRVLRESKARRIERIVREAAGDLARSDVLDIGTGAGHIASYLRPRVRSLLSIDVVDERVARDFEFQLVDSERLPLADGSMDIVVSNHVIEHVEDQRLHLREIRRVLRARGVCYLATPNRFAVLEPHFRLPLLSWMPAGMRDRYVRAARRGARFDVTPLTYSELASLAAEAGLPVRDCSIDVARDVVAGRLPVAPSVGGWLRPLLPSFVVLLSPEARA